MKKTMLKPYKMLKKYLYLIIKKVGKYRIKLLSNAKML